jgi:glycosyltransferase involved in cell wall biosynthesis
MERKKIAFLDEGKGIGGAEKNLIAFLDYLNKDKFEPLVILSHKEKLFTAVNAIGIETLLIKAPPFYSTSLEFGRIRILNPFAIIYDAIIILIKSIKLRSYLSHNNVSILQTNGMDEHIYGGIAAKLANIPCIWYMQDIPKGFMHRFKAFLLNILAFILPKRVIAASQAVQGVFYNPVRRKSAIIYNNIDSSKYKLRSSEEIAQLKKKWGLYDAECVVAMAGRLVYWKGHIIFIKAAKIVNEIFPKIKFLIAGDIIFGREQYRENLKKLIKQLGLEGKVVFTGFVEDVTEVLSIIDIFVQCSLYPDPCPIAILEAGALKKPIIATRVGGIPEIIKNDKEGILVEPANYKILAEEIIKLINSPQQRTLLGEQAYCKIKDEFDIKHKMQKFEEIYRLYK